MIRLLSLAEYMAARERALDILAGWRRADPARRWDLAHALWLGRFCPRAVFDRAVPPRDTRPLPLP